MKSLILACLSTILLSADAYSGELSRRAIRHSTTWISTDCYSPSPPSTYVYDLHSYNLAVNEFNNFLLEAETYLDCVQDEAQSDLKKFQRFLAEGLEKHHSEIQSEINNMRYSLENSRLYLE